MLEALSAGKYKLLNSVFGLKHASSASVSVYKSFKVSKLFCKVVVTVYGILYLRKITFR